MLCINSTRCLNIVALGRGPAPDGHARQVVGRVAIDHQPRRRGVIAQHFDVPKGSRGSVRSVLEDVTLCIEEQREYCGSRKQVPRARALISTEGFEASTPVSSRRTTC